MLMNGGGSNPKDPLPKTGPEQQLQLFKRFNEAANGFPIEIVIGAAINVFVNAVRQSYPLRHLAEARWNEIIGRYKQVLLDHYDGVTGKRRNIFPFTQYVNMERIVDKDAIRKN